MIWKYHNEKLQADLWHREEESHNNREASGRQASKATSPFPINTLAKLEWPQSNAQQNIEQLQNPTMGATINN